MSRKNKTRQEDLIERLHANGVRKRLATTVAGGRGGRKRGDQLARQLLKQLDTARATLRDEVLGEGKSAKRSEAAKKAARTRKRNAEKRSLTAKKGARTRAKAKG